MKRPTLRIVAGSNGSGKSTITASSRYRFQQNSLLDPDAVARSLQQMVDPNSSNIDAGREVLRLAEEQIAKRQSFTVETTLSGNTYLKMASRAKEAGFNIMVVFVGTEAVEINMERVKARVIKGGHNVSEQDQRRRYPRTLANIRRLLPFADLAVILDNSGESHEIVGVGRKGTIHWEQGLPNWAEALRSEQNES